MPNGTCQIDGCEKPRFNRGWCAGHWNRVRRKGDPGSPELRPKRTGCLIDGCERRHFAHGYCQTHAYRLRENGDPLVVREVPVHVGADHPGWRGDDVNYNSTHARVRRTRGRAAEHDCIHCGGAADDWAYIHGSPDEKVEAGRRFSPSVENYMPLCRTCHRAYDNQPGDAWLEVRGL